MNQILYSGRAKKSPKALIIGIVVVAVILIALLFTFGFGIANLSNDKILKGVIVANVDVSDMTKEEAIEAINKVYEESENSTLSLKYKDYTIDIVASNIGFNHTNANDLVELAYAYGRDGNIVENNFTVLKSFINNEKRIETESKIDNVLLEKVVNDLASGDSMFAKDDSYEISGDKLIITKGIVGERIDFATLSTRVLEAINQKQELVEIPIITSKPRIIDLDKLYAGIHKDPVNASYKEGENFELISGENGIDFNLNEAKELYSKTERGESMEIQLVITEPEIKLEDLSDKLFENLIATHTSKYDNSIKNRVTNLQIAVNKCNDIILYPGDVFSFNNALGHRTLSNGYKMADSYADGKIVQSVGGGICQVSSTLYNAVLKADLKVVERTAHGMYVQYVEPSTDATVVDDSIDFKFMNSRKYPIKIVTTCENGVVTASIYGIKEKDEPTIEIESKILETKDYKVQRQNDSTLEKGKTKVVQSPVNGYVSEAYKVYYKDGKEVSRTLISKDTYAPIDQIIKVGTKEPPAVATPEPPAPPAIEPLPEIIPPGWDNPESGYGH